VNAGLKRPWGEQRAADRAVDGRSRAAVWIVTRGDVSSTRRLYSLLLLSE
jgi:hypothetical protein